MIHPVLHKFPQPIMADPFTIRIFAPNGDPEGVRLIDRMNWTGLGIAFPRSKWVEVRQRSIKNSYRSKTTSGSWAKFSLDFQASSTRNPPEFNLPTTTFAE